MRIFGKKLSSALFCCLLLTAAPVCFANSQDDDRARLLLLVPVEIEALAHSAADCQPPRAHFTRADFDGDRTFRYVIVSYFAVCGPRITSAVRVLRETDGKLLPYQTPQGLEFRTGQMLAPDVIDMDNNGVPEVMFRVWQGPDTIKPYSLLLFSWNEATLQPISTANIDTRNAAFRDLEADGRLELVTLPRCLISKYRRRSKEHRGEMTGPAASGTKSCAGPRIYFYRGGEFSETGLSRSEVHLVSLGTSDKEFSFAETRPSGEPAKNEEFVLRLEWSSNPKKNDPFPELRAQTLLLGRTLRPLAVASKLEKRSSNCKNDEVQGAHCFQAQTIEARFSREAVARMLPKLQLTKRLEPGDRVSVPITALMENGDYVSAAFMVSISK